MVNVGAVKRVVQEWLQLRIDLIAKAVHHKWLQLDRPNNRSNNSSNNSSNSEDRARKTYSSLSAAVIFAI